MATNVLDGVFAINKPTGMSSAEVLRQCQTHFIPSEFFGPKVADDKRARKEESKRQQKKRRDQTYKMKLGHGGTLDPLATGVLIAGLGSGTKSLSSFLACTKTYETIVLFGYATDSYDRLGKLIQRAPYEHITKEKVEKALEAFRGKIEQVPPIFSALKMDGMKLYEYARKERQVPREIPKRSVEVLELELTGWAEGGLLEFAPPTEKIDSLQRGYKNRVWPLAGIEPAKLEKKRKFDGEDDLVFQRPSSKHAKNSKSEGTATDDDPPMMSGGLPADSPKSKDGLEYKSKNVTKYQPDPSEQIPKATASDPGPPAVKLRMTVSSGFYVRSLCHDLGVAVGSAGCMAELKRTRQGQFEVGKNVLEYKDLGKGEDVWAPKVQRMLKEWKENEWRKTSKSLEDGEKVKEGQSAESGGEGEDKERAAKKRKVEGEVQKVILDEIETVQKKGVQEGAVQEGVATEDEHKKEILEEQTMPTTDSGAAHEGVALEDEHKKEILEDPTKPTLEEGAVKEAKVVDNKGDIENDWEVVDKETS